jgi:dermatan 4-sulfotransferase 1
MIEYPQWFLDARKRYKIKREKPQVWIFPSEKLAYIQIPKVATRTIRDALFHSYARHNGASIDFEAFEAANSKHASLSEIRAETANGFTLFAFVRHPLARLCSAYENKLAADRPHEKNIFSCHGMYRGMPFGEFIEIIADLGDDRIDRHLRSQSWFLRDGKGLLPNWIGRLESFNSDYEQLAEKFPSLRGALVHKNKSIYKKSFDSMFDQRSLRLAKDRYKQDLELFGYDVEGFFDLLLL